MALIYAVFNINTKTFINLMDDEEIHNISQNEKAYLFTEHQLDSLNKFARQILSELPFWTKVKYLFFKE